MIQNRNTCTATNDDDGTQSFIEPVTLDVLFSYPFFWKASKVCEFLKDAHKLLRDRQNEKEIKEFQDRFNRQGRLPNYTLWPNESNWKIVLDEFDDRHFEILTTGYTKGKAEKRSEKYLKYLGNLNTLTNVSSLFDVIRNKHQHSGDFPPEIKEILGWFTDNGNLDEKLFVEYWDDRFPKLVPFLWLEFYDFHQIPTLKQFYPYSLKKFKNVLSVDIEDVLEQIEAAFFDHLEKGGVISRFTMGKNVRELILEFRSFPVDVVQKLLDGSSGGLEIEAFGDSVLCKWYQKYYDPQGSPISKRIRRSRICLKASSMIIIGNSLCNMWTERCTGVHTNFIRQRRKGSRAIFCISEFRNGQLFPEDIYDVIERYEGYFGSPEFEQDDVKLADLSERTREKLKNEAKLCFHGREFKLKDVLPVNDDQLLYDLSLEGEVLNALLQNGSMNAFQGFDLPLPSLNYRKRCLIDRKLINVRSFEEIFDNDLFVILNCSLSDFVRESKCKPELIKKFDNAPLAPGMLKIDVRNVQERVILLQPKLTDFSVALDALQIEAAGKNVHILAHFEGPYFRWLKSIGDFSHVEIFFSKARVKTGLINEDTLIKSTIKDTGQMVFIADKPGMGKSQILMSLARKIGRKQKDRFVIFLSMNDFIESIRWCNELISSKERCIENIILALNYHFDLHAQFETRLLTSWIERPNSARFKIELMLDGLDEVVPRFRTFAFRVLRNIRDELPSVRVWVTLRDHMLEDTKRTFGCLGYKLEPFSKQDQVMFLVNHWLDVWKTKGNAAPSKKRLKRWRAFAETCLRLPLTDKNLEVAGIPLQCRMIAEINANKVMSESFTQSSQSKNGIYTLVDLYEEFIEGKLEIYLREKKNIQISMNDAIANIMRRQMERTHSYFSLKLLFPAEVADKFHGQLLLNKSGIDEINTAALEQGIIQKLKPLTFVHRTFAEFFAAKFCFRVVSGEYMHISENERHFLFKHLLETTCVAETGSSGSCEFRFPVVAQFFDGMWEKRAFIGTAEFKHFFFEAVCKIGKGYETVSLYRPDSSMIVAAKRAGEDNIIALLLSSSEQQVALFESALLFQCYDYCQYVIENCRYFTPWHLHQMMKWGDNGNGFFHWLVRGVGMPLKSRYDVSKLKSFLNHIKSKAKFYFCYMLEERDRKGRTPLLLLLNGDESLISPTFSNGPFVKDVVWYFIYNLKADLCATDYENNTVLHVNNEYTPNRGHAGNAKVAYNELLAHISLKESKMRKIINCKNNESGRTPLLQAVQVIGELELDTLVYFKVNGADFNAQDKNGWTVLHVAVERKCSFEFIQKLIEFGVDVLRPNMNGETAVHFAEKRNDTHLVHLLQPARRNANSGITESREYNLEELNMQFNDFRKKQCMLRKAHIVKRLVGRSTSLDRLSSLLI